MTHKLTKDQIDKFRIFVKAGVGVLHGGVPRPEAGISPPHGHVPRPERVVHEDMVYGNLLRSLDSVSLTLASIPDPPPEPIPDVKKYEAACQHERAYYVSLSDALFWTQVWYLIMGCYGGVPEEGSYCANSLAMQAYFQDELLVSASRIKQFCGVSTGGKT